MASYLANEIADISESTMTLTQQVSLHLSHNIYPVPSKEMVTPCVEAIKAYWNGDSELLIKLPEGISWRGQDKAPAWALLEAHGLEEWTAAYDYDEWNDYLNEL